MAISQLGTGVGLANQTVASGHASWNHTLSSGSLRAVYVTLGIESGENITALSITYGGNSPTGSLRVEQGTGFENNGAAAWWLESDLPSDGSKAVVVAWTGPATGIQWSGYCNSVQDVLQATPTTAQDSGATVTSVSASVSPANGDWVIGALSLGDTFAATASNGETTENSVLSGSSRFYSYAHDPAGGSETAVGATFSSTNRAALAVVHFAQFVPGPVLVNPTRRVNHLLVR